MQSSNTAKELEEIARLMEVAEEGLNQAYNLLDLLSTNRETDPGKLKELQTRASLLKSNMETMEEQRHRLISSRFRI